MRRQRAATIEAESVEHFIQLSLEADSKVTGEPLPKPKHSKTFCLPTHGKKYRVNSPKIQIPKPSFKAVFSITPVDDSKWNKKDEEDEKQQLCYSPEGKSGMESDSTAESAEKKKGSTRASLSDDRRDFMEDTKQIKIMVVGGKRTGRHTLINSLFEKNVKDTVQLRNALDLVIKKEQDKERLHVFKFWIQDALFNNNLEKLMRVHYKSTHFYIFVYKTTDRKSFECLEETIIKIKEENGDNFNGILVGNIRHSQSFFANLFSPKKKRAVLYEEGEALRQKYGLMKFVESTVGVNNLRKEVFEALLSK